MFQISEVAEACNGQIIGAGTALSATGISTDTRQLEKGCIFFALRGKNFDGHRFLREAAEKGALAAVIDSRAWKELELFGSAADYSGCLIVVEDVYDALGRFAHSYRKQFKIPIIAVTGSAGKTTTKECIGALLSRRMKLCTGFGNLNNHIGLPLNLIKLRTDDRAGVFELGASARGEIRYLSSMAEPRMGVVTCVQPVHLESFGSLESIYAAKLELAEFLAEKGGLLFANGDDPVLVQRASALGVRTFWFGHSAQCQYRISDEFQENGMLHFVVNDRHRFALKGAGLFNTMNALAAIAVADQCGLGLAEASREWHELASAPNRFELESIEGARIKLVKDCYNANPVAFRLALESFERLACEGRRCAVVGDMKELGPESERYHKELGSALGASSVEVLVAVGEFGSTVCASALERNPNLITGVFSSALDSKDFLFSRLREGDSVLLKGSRAMHLERVSEFLKTYSPQRMASKI